MTLEILKELWGWNAPQTFQAESLGLIISTMLATFMWLSARANYKMQEKLSISSERMDTEKEHSGFDHEASISEQDKEKKRKKKKSIVFPTEGQVTVTREKKSSMSLVYHGGQDSNENSRNMEDTPSNDSESSLKSASYNIEKLGAKKHLKILKEHLKVLFRNPIFVTIVIIGFCYDGTIVCFTGIVKRLLKSKFQRSDKQVAIEMGFTKYCGFAAPFAGHIIDKIRNREWFMLMAGLCLVFATFSLFACDRDNILVLYIALFGISFGQVCYGNSFWPAIASVAGRKYQIVGYGFMGAVTSIGAVILPQICGRAVDYFDKKDEIDDDTNDKYNIVVACLIFGVLTLIGTIACVVIILMNNVYYAGVNYLNRHLSSKKNSKSSMTMRKEEDIKIHIETNMKVDTDGEDKVETLQ